MLRLAYNTNGLAHHRLTEALELLADLGYAGVAITPDVGQLDPARLDPREVAEVRRVARDRGLALAVETGGRFLLDPRRKHWPTLLEEEAAVRRRRVDFLRRSVDLAAELGAEVVSLWSGAAPDGRVADGAPGSAGLEGPWDRLCAGLAEVLDHAGGTGVRVAFEPEPGMFVERPVGYRELRRRLGGRGERLGLCLDVGHLLVTGDLPVESVIRSEAPHLVHVHLDDIRAGVHEHLPFGRGDLDLEGTLSALKEVGYAGLAAVELSRDSHRGAEAAAEAWASLARALDLA